MSPLCWDIAEGRPLGLIEGGFVITGQVAAVVVTWVYSLVVSFVLLKLVDVTLGLRADLEAERLGLDISQHEEEGYMS